MPQSFKRDEEIYVPSSTCHKLLGLEGQRVHRKLSKDICCAMRRICQHPKWSKRHSLRVSPSCSAQAGTNDTWLSRCSHSELSPKPQHKTHTPQTQILFPFSFFFALNRFSSSTFIVPLQDHKIMKMPFLCLKSMMEIMHGLPHTLDT